MNEGSRYPQSGQNDFQVEKRRSCLGVCHQLGAQELYPGTLILPWSLILERNEKVVADIFLVLL